MDVTEILESLLGVCKILPKLRHTTESKLLYYSTHKLVNIKHSSLLSSQSPKFPVVPSLVSASRCGAACANLQLQLQLQGHSLLVTAAQSWAWAT